MRPGASAAQRSFALPDELQAAWMTKPAEARLDEEEGMERVDDHQLKLVADKAAG